MKVDRFIKALADLSNERECVSQVSHGG
jgi:hypothetical protein